MERGRRASSQRLGRGDVIGCEVMRRVGDDVGEPDLGTAVARKRHRELAGARGWLGEVRGEEDPADRPGRALFVLLHGHHGNL